MKRFVLFAFFLSVAFLGQAQLPGLPGKWIEDDSTHMGFSTKFIADTVDETDTFYMFNPRPDSGLVFVHSVQWFHSPCKYDEDTKLFGCDTLLRPEHFDYEYEHVAHKFHVDSAVTLYGFAVTMSPTIYLVEKKRDKPYANSICQDYYEYEGVMSKEAMKFRFELLKKVASDTDSVMQIVDTLWLDTSHTIKRCWFKYKMDSIGPAKFTGMVRQYWPQRKEVVVPCYEVYFDNPFEASHTIANDFYLGRTIDVNCLSVPYYKDDYNTECLVMSHFAPIYRDDSASDMHYFRYDDAGNILGDVGLPYDWEWWKASESRPWGLLFPITGLRCKQIHNLHVEEKGERYIVLGWEGGDDEDIPEYQVKMVAHGEDTDIVIDQAYTTDTTRMYTDMVKYNEYTFMVRKSCHYVSTHYDTVIWGDWYPIDFMMKEPDTTVVDTTIVDTTAVDTTIVDTTIVDTTIVDTTGIRLTLGDADFSLQPNPARGSAELRLQYPVAETAELTLYDMQGRTVRMYPLEQGTKRVTINLEGLPAGAYLLKLLTPRGLGTRRLLVR